MRHFLLDFELYCLFSEYFKGCSLSYIMATNIFLLSILSTVSCQGTFYVSSEMSTWSSSGDECIPATPKVDAAISYSPSVYSVSNPGIDLPDNEDVWVGYYQVVRVFEYIGCVEQRYFVDFFQTQPLFTSIKADPGHCFPYCGESTVIGVTRTRCYCLGDTFNFTRKTEAGCTDKCDHPTVACGQDRTPDKYTYISIYKINPKDIVTASSISVTLLPSENKDCLSLDPNVPRRFYWNICSFSLKAMCVYEGRVEIAKCKTGSEYCTWIDAANTCLHRGRFPTSYSNSKDVVKGDLSPLWTGLFKTNVVYKHNANIPKERRHDKKQFGYLTKESETSVKLKFTEDDSMKKILCLQDRIKNMTRTTHVTKTVSDSVNTTEFSSSSTTMLPNTSDTDEGISVIYIAVGTCVSVVLVAAVVVLLIVFLKRRRRKANQECSPQHNSTTIPSIENDNDYPALAEPNTSQGKNDYFILEPKGKEDENINETYDTATEDTVYDSAQERQDYEKVKSENVYNHLDTGQDTTYDHASAGDAPKTAVPVAKFTDDTSVYDSSTTVNKPIHFKEQSDNIYNKSNEVDGDEYQHLGINIKQSKTDNLYGIQLIKNRDESLNEEQSTYNCISNDTRNTAQTDNTYSSLDEK